VTTGRKPRGTDIFPAETAKIAALLNLRRPALAVTCAMLGLGLGNKQIAQLRGVSVKTVETEIQQALLIVSITLKLGFIPRIRQLVIICHELLEGWRLRATKLNREYPDHLETNSLTSIYNLSPREAEVTALVALCYGNTEIAEMLYISVKTVSVHRENAKRKIRAALKLDKISSNRKFMIIVHDIMDGRLPKGLSLA